MIDDTSLSKHVSPVISKAIENGKFRKPVRNKFGVVQSWDCTASHLPVLLSAIDSFDTSRVLEVGSGYYSTPMLCGLVDNVIAIESSDQFISKLSKIISNDICAEFIKGPHIATYETFVNFYRNLADRIGDINLLFIDGSVGSRKPAFNVFSERSDVVVIHDAGDANQHEHLLNDDTNRTFVRFLYKSFHPQTFIFVKRDVDTTGFDSCIAKWGEYIAKQYKMEYTHDLTIV